MITFIIPNTTTTPSVNNDNNSYLENIDILVNTWNVGIDVAELFGDTLNKTILMLYDTNRAASM